MDDAGTYDIDLTAPRRRLTVTVDAGGGPRALTLLGPRRREARALDACMEASRAAADGGGQEAFYDALYAAAAAVLSRNAEGVAFDADGLADELPVSAAADLVAAYSRLRDAVEADLGNA